MAVLRIWHQSTTEIDHIGVYKQSLIDRARLILDADVELDVHGLPGGAYQGGRRAPHWAMPTCIIAFSNRSSTTWSTQSGKAMQPS